MTPIEWGECVVCGIPDDVCTSMALAYEACCDMCAHPALAPTLPPQTSDAETVAGEPVHGMDGLPAAGHREEDRECPHCTYPTVVDVGRGEWECYECGAVNGPDVPTWPRP